MQRETMKKHWLAGGTACALAAALTAPIALAASVAKAGGSCTRKQANKTIGTLICKKEGSKYIYREVQVTAVTAATIAPVAAPGAYDSV